MKKAIKFLSVALATVLAAGFVSCTKDATETNVNEEKGESYLELSIVIPNSSSAMTRGEGTSEDSGKYDYGIGDEYKVNSVRLYFVNASTDMVATYKDFTSFVKSADMGAPSATSREVWKTSSPQTVTGLTVGQAYKVYAIVNENPSGTFSSTSELMVSKFKSYTDASSLKDIPTTGIPMSSRSTDDEGTTSCDMTLTSANTSVSNPAQLSFEVERAWGKISLMAKDTTINSTSYVNAYPIKKTITNVSDGTTETVDLAMVTLTEYKLINLMGDNYVFRHVGTEAGGDINYGPMDDTTQFVITPHFSEFTGTPSTNPHTWLFDQDSYSTMITDASNYSEISYAYENTMPIDRQLQGNCTGIIFKGEIVPDDTNAKVMYMNGSEVAEYDSFADVPADTTALYYVAGNFYTSIKALQTKTNSFAGLTDTTLADNNVNKYVFNSDHDALVCYYKYWIRHYDNENNTVQGPMEFAIVRNNVYNLQVSKVKRLGDDTEDIEPDNPIETENYYLDITLKIRPWIVRTNDIVFD